MLLWRRAFDVRIMSFWLRSKDSEGRTHYTTIEIVGLYMLLVVGLLILFSVVLAIFHG